MEWKSLSVRLAFFIDSRYMVNMTIVVRDKDGVYNLDKVQGQTADWVAWLFEGQMKVRVNREFEIKDVYIEVPITRSLDSLRVAVIKSEVGECRIKLPLEVIEDLTTCLGEKFGYKMLLQEVVDTLGL